jgi:ATP-dependent DNA helicase PIF1
LIGGTTLHSYLGIGLGTGDVEFLYMKIKNRPIILKRWLDLDILIIDEISMLSPDLFDKLEALARVIRKNDLPFGDIQLILTGDFLQLPCINSKKFCFEAKSWEKCITKVAYLTENFRQGDEDFQKCLSEVRIGQLSPESINLLKSRKGVKLSNELGILPTKIYALNRDVDEENNNEIQKLFSKDSNLEFFEYNMEYKILKKGLKDPEEVARKGCNAPATLELCKGAQVMLLYNIDLEAKLANGSRGVVVDFVDDLPVVRFLTGEERIIDYHTWKIQEQGVDVLHLEQIPLKIAFAISIHKGQGITVDYAEIDMEGIFEDGMAYVALSRVTSLNGLSIKNFRLGNIFANEKAVQFYKDLENL